MTPDEVIAMAEEAGFSVVHGYLRNYKQGTGLPELQLLADFAALVAAKEREECAQVCDAEASAWEKNSDGQVSIQGIAAAIRERAKGGAQ